MSDLIELRTPRCVLRQWRSEDLAPWRAMNADAEVRRHFPTVLSGEQANGEAQRCRDAIANRGWGMWALEVPGVLEFAGFVGLNIPSYEAPWMPAVEIGWRLRQEAWGQGYATEAAREALHFAFQTLKLDQVVALTVPGNTASRRVMEKLGMTTRADDDFDHPRVQEGHPLRRHLLYRIARPQ
jgi:RimJ/RimL family protein N-acetyltransferase